MAPKIVAIAVKNTGAVPNFPVLTVNDFIDFRACKTNLVGDEKK